MTAQNKQPPVNAQQVVQRAIATHIDRPGTLLPILHDIQRALRHIPKSAVSQIALALNLSRAEVHGVISFYHSFTEQPQGRTVIEVCRAEACQAMGGRAVEYAFKSRSGLDWGGTSEDGSITLESVYCLGNCACSPAVRIGDDIIGRVTPADVDTLLDKARESQHDA